MALEVGAMYALGSVQLVSSASLRRLRNPPSSGSICCWRPSYLDPGLRGRGASPCRQPDKGLEQYRHLQVPRWSQSFPDGCTSLQRHGACGRLSQTWGRWYFCWGRRGWKVSQGWNLGFWTVSLPSPPFMSVSLISFPCFVGSSRSKVKTSP